ncbi:MAG: hypothetical protein INR73_12715 [Williamsia sp.]|nr:hypothetical protein [Williamsia sp.]
MKRVLYIAVILIVCIGFFFYSCEKDEVVSTPVENPALNTKATTYLIRQGNHYCEQNAAELMIDPVIHATVTFDSSAIYTSQDAVNQGDVNKLIGFSDCNSNHQENSARLGWSWTGKRVALYAYAYSNKVRIIKSLGTVDINQSFPCSVRAGSNFYYFTVNNRTDSVERACSGYTGYRYKLFPYFGGDEAAPHDVRIVVVEEQPGSQNQGAK